MIFFDFASFKEPDVLALILYTQNKLDFIVSTTLLVAFCINFSIPTIRTDVGWFWPCDTFFFYNFYFEGFCQPRALTWTKCTGHSFENNVIITFWNSIGNGIQWVICSEGTILTEHRTNNSSTAINRQFSKIDFLLTAMFLQNAS